MRDYLKFIFIVIHRIAAIFLWMVALILFIAGLGGILTPDYSYRDGAIKNLVINVPLFALAGFLCWSQSKLSDK